MKKLLLIICLAWQTPIQAEVDSAPREQPNRFEEYRFVIPPLPKESATAPEDHVITGYDSSIRPGANLPDAVYECVLDNMDGIGSDTAALLVWQACLRLNLK